MSFAMMGSVEILGTLFSDLKNLSSALCFHSWWRVPNRHLLDNFDAVYRH